MRPTFPAEAHTWIRIRAWASAAHMGLGDVAHRSARRGPAHERSRSPGSGAEAERTEPRAESI